MTRLHQYVVDLNNELLVIRDGTVYNFAVP